MVLNKNKILKKYYSRVSEIYKEAKEDKRWNNIEQDKIIEILYEIKDVKLRNKLKNEINNNRLFMSANEVYLCEYFYKERFFRCINIKKINN